jgi:PKHD-type hydroxylase
MHPFHLRPNLAGDPTCISGLLSPDECNGIIGKCERDLKVGAGRIAGERVDVTVRKSEIAWIAPESENRWLFERVKDCLKSVNAEWYQYDLIGIEGIQFTKYSGADGQSSFYASHIDLRATRFGTVRKLSFSVQLSQPDAYDGGDVLLYRSLSESAAISRAAGSITFFPSYTIHEVAPVTRGVRYSLVGWAHGPGFV